MRNSIFLTVLVVIASVLGTNATWAVFVASAFAEHNAAVGLSSFAVVSAILALIALLVVGANSRSD